MDLYSVKKPGALLFVTDTSRAHEMAVKVPRRPQSKRRATRFVVILVAAVMVGNAFIGERGLIAMIRANRDFASLSRIIAALRAENERLRNDVRQLSEDPLAIEEVARRELGLIRPGESLFIVTTVPALQTSSLPVP